MPLPQAELLRKPGSRFGLKCGFLKLKPENEPHLQMGAWLRLVGSESVAPTRPQALG